MRSIFFGLVGALCAFALGASPARADTLVTIVPTGATSAAVTERWAVGSGLSGLGYIDGNSGFSGATATNFFTITGATIPAAGDPAGFLSYLPGGDATPQSSVGNGMLPLTYCGLTYVAADLGLIGPLSFYTIHHAGTGDYLALIQPAVPTISDQKPMSAPGGPLTPGAAGYFALTSAADNPGGWGAELFYYLRTNAIGETVFGSLVPALLSGPTDRFNLGAGRGFTDLAYTTTDLGFGFGPSQFYYLRLDPVTQTTFFGWINATTGVATDIQNLGKVCRTLTFTPTNLGYGANSFYSIEQAPIAQTITFAAIANHTTCDDPFTLTAPTATSGLAITLTATGPATIGAGNVVTLTGSVGTVVITATQAGNAVYAAAAAAARSFTVAACVVTPPVTTPLLPQTITFAPIADHTTCDDAFTLAAPAASSGLPITLTFTGAVTISSGNVVTFTGAVGTVVITASQAGNSVYAAATAVTQSFAVTACGSTPPVVIAPVTVPPVVVTPPVVTPPVLTPPATVVPPATVPIITSAQDIQPYFLPNLSGLAIGPHDVNGVVGTPLSYQIVATGSPLSYGAVLIPAGLAFDPTTGLIAGTPTAANTWFTTVSASNSAGSGSALVIFAIASPVVPSSQITNVSASTISGPGASALVMGFVTSGPTFVLARGVGPTLATFGIAGVLPDPTLTLAGASGVLATDVAWQDGTPSSGQAISAAALQIGAFALSSGSADSALLTQISGGAYTTTVTGASGDSGMALSEVYDLSASATDRFVNVSVRASLSQAQPLLTAGFSITGNAPKTVLIRGIGPSLTQFGIAAPLPDPLITLRSGTTVIAADSGWTFAAATAASQVGAFPLIAGSADAAITVSLSPGDYTVQVTSPSAAAGIVLFELYDLE